MAMIATAIAVAVAVAVAGVVRDGAKQAVTKMIREMRVVEEVVEAVEAVHLLHRVVYRRHGSRAPRLRG